MDDRAFTIWQSHLSSRLGVSIEELREARKNLTEGVDFTTVKNRVLFTEKGAQALAGALGVHVSVLPKLIANGAIAEEGDGFLCEIPKNGANGEKHPLPFVVHRKTGNVHIMEAYPSGSDPAVRSNIVRIRVRDSQNFMRGMKLEALPCAAQGLYEFKGRLPRWPGKY